MKCKGNYSLHELNTAISYPTRHDGRERERCNENQCMYHGFVEQKRDFVVLFQAYDVFCRYFFWVLKCELVLARQTNLIKRFGSN